MAVRNMDEFKKVFEELNDDMTPERITQLAEDVADTINDMRSQIDTANSRAQEVETEWRRKYTSRFFEGAPEGSREFQQEDEKDRAEEIGFDDLFT